MECFNNKYYTFVDWEGVRNLVQALPPSVKRFVLVSSVGVTKFNELPWRYAYYFVMFTRCDLITTPCKGYAILFSFCPVVS